MKAQTFDIETFVTHYMIAALWTEEYDTKTINDIPDNIAKEMKKDCEIFIDSALGDNLFSTHNQESQYSLEEQAGHDFWLTRNGHGAGFWDRVEVWGEENKNKLSKLCEEFGEYNLNI